MSSRVNQLLQRLERDLAMKKKEEAEKYPRNPETGLPEPKNFEQLLAVVNDMVQMNRTLFLLQRELEAALPKKEEKLEPLNDDQFMQQYLSGDRYQDMFKMVFGVNPVTIALVALDEFFKRERFVHINPNDLEFAKDLREPYQKEKITNTTIEIGGKTIATPMNNEFWLEDKETQAKFIVEYKPSPGGQVAVTVYSDYSKDEEAMKLISEIKLAVLQSPFIRGQVIEISGGSGFNVVDIGEQPMPIIAKDLQEELEKNVINIFDKADEFKAMGQAICRKIILSGGPGNGKTMIERYLASRLSGKVTTIWVSAKSIEQREHIDDIFEIARKLSPALIIMEDLDLISGTRTHYGHDSMLGEMLNQLDGLKKNDAVVVVASTNCVADLDEALNDRPERFDRIFEVGKPTTELAQKIATEYLVRKCNVPEDVVKSLNLAKYFPDKEFSGAQIVEVIRGAIFEAVHRGLGKNINEQCIKASKEGLTKQRDLIVKKQK